MSICTHLFIIYSVPSMWQALDWEYKMSKTSSPQWVPTSVVERRKANSSYSTMLHVRILAKGLWEHGRGFICLWAVGIRESFIKRDRRFRSRGIAEAWESMLDSLVYGRVLPRGWPGTRRVGGNLPCWSTGLHLNSLMPF